jgi:hypothetical protein
MVLHAMHGMQHYFFSRLISSNPTHFPFVALELVHRVHCHRVHGTGYTALYKIENKKKH